MCEYFEYTLCHETHTNKQPFHLAATNIRTSVKNYDANDEYTCYEVYESYVTNIVFFVEHEKCIQEIL